MAVKYDPAVIVESAERLYGQAGQLIFTWAVGTGLVSGGAAFLVARVIYKEVDPLDPVFVGVMGALLGAAVGRAKGLLLRLRAQEALCQLQVEINTRPAQRAPELPMSEQS